MFDPESPPYLPRNVSHSFGKYEARVRVGGIVKRKRFENKFDADVFVEAVMLEQQKAHTERNLCFSTKRGALYSMDFTKATAG